MSREVQGDAPADAAVGTAPRTTGLPPDDRPPPAATGTFGGPFAGPFAGRAARVAVGRILPGRLADLTRGRPSAALVALLTLLLTGACGWLAAGAWQPPAPPPPPEAVTAVALDARPETADPSPIGLLRVQLRNAGDHPVDVVGYETPRYSAFITGLQPRRLTVPAGAGRELLVRFGVSCGGTAPLDLPGLRVRRPDGGLRPVPLDGVAEALARFCSDSERLAPLVLDSVRRDGDRLELRLRVPGGRTTRVDAASAGAVALDGSDLPTSVDGGGTTVWLSPPDRCPVRWQQTGIPRSLSLQADLGGDATLTLRVGSLMSDWILDTACRRVAAG